MNKQSNCKVKKIKIGFLSHYSPKDRKASSGTNFKMAEELRKIGDLKWIPIKSKFIGIPVRVLCRLWNKIFKKRFLIVGTFWGSKNMYSKIRQEAMEDCDIIAAFFCMPVLANLKTDKPIIYFTDTTAPNMLDYYPYFSNVFNFNKKQFIELEKRAMDKSDAIVISSEWAANSATGALLNQDKNKIHIIEFGANIDDKDLSITEREIKDELNILFMGVEWDRKGGDIAVEAVKWLNEQGVASKLHIVGIKEVPGKYKDLSFIVNHGFLNKNIPDDYKLLNKILCNTNCLLLPTKAECSAIAFSEASANGLPVFTHETGGVPNYIINGKNGYMLPLGSTGIEFGMKIKEVIESGELKKLSEGGKILYREKLNWNTWRKKVEIIIRSLVSKQFC